MASRTTRRQRFDVICVGDVASDVFITLSPDQVEVRGEAGEPTLVVPFGAKLPYESVATVPAGGNAANAAVACARLGLHVALAAFVGADQLGRDAVAALNAEGVDTSLVRLDQQTPTNSDFVLRLGQERTILVRHAQHDYHWPHLRPSEVPAWLYLSSVGREAQAYEDQIADWLEETPSVELAFEPGTYQIAQGPQRLARLYRRAGLMICNREEAETICGCPPAEDMDTLLAAMLALGPRRVVITDAAAGAFGAMGGERYSVPIYPDREPVIDRTGAGDAFAATLLACIVRGMSLEEAMLRAPVNSMSVVHAIGTQAGLLTTEEIAAHLEGLPDGFAVESHLVAGEPAGRARPSH
ncbi:MAG: carbohydrate kinase family protein [Acidimicrobiales bacterium]|jgi:ribokinase